MVGTLPGRTQGLGLITEPLLQDLGLSRISYAQLNFWATIVGAAGAVGVGRLVDRFGTRVVLTTVAAALGAVVIGMSLVQSFAALAIAVTLTRAIGQSALSVVSIAMVGHWFVRRLDAAMAVYSVVLSVGFMIAFPLVGWAIQAWGWRSAWLAIGVALVAVLAPAAWAIARRSPESVGLAPDSEPADRDAASGRSAGVAPRAETELAGYTWNIAVATPAFWVFAAGTALYGLVASGIGLFNESILAERGFGAEVYYQTLVVTAMTALAGNFFGGWFARRTPLARLLAVALAILAGGVAMLPHASTLTHVMVWATVMGLGGGMVMVLFFSVWPRVFGRRHLGQIQGAAQALTVLASAIGPLLLAWSFEWTGSYRSIFHGLALVVGVTAAAALVVALPPPVHDVDAGHREVQAAR